MYPRFGPEETTLATIIVAATQSAPTLSEVTLIGARHLTVAMTGLAAALLVSF